MQTNIEVLVEKGLSYFLSRPRRFGKSLDAAEEIYGHTVHSKANLLTLGCDEEKCSIYCKAEQ